MDTAEVLKKKIQTTEDLQSVVKTMKALAAVNIRQYEKAVQSVTEYMRTIELGLRAVLQMQPIEEVSVQSTAEGRIGAIVYGSDQGMSGQLNEQIVAYAIEAMNDLGVKRTGRFILAVGRHGAIHLEDAGQPVEESFPLPGSPTGITALVQDILLKIEEWHVFQGVDRIVLFYNQLLSSVSYRPHLVHLLPVDQQWLNRLERTPWPSHVLPLFTMGPERLFSSLIRQYLFVSLHRACAESLASEHASRLASMQGAERNIEEHLAELRAQFRQMRQMSITEELLDLVTGFEALGGQRV